MERMKFDALPFYRWFVRDYRASRKVQRMGYTARGFYRELLDEEWLQGSIPNDLESLAEICGCPMKVMEKTWSEISPCFTAVNGRLVNEKLESLRTEQDALRVKRIAAGRLGGLAKQSVANANQAPANAKQVPYSRAEKSKSREEQSKTSSRAKKQREGANAKASPPTVFTGGEGTKALDTVRAVAGKESRHAEFKAAIAEYWQFKNPNDEMPWGAEEGRNLGIWLSSSPKTTVEQFRGYLRNRARSEVNHADRPSMWIRKITSFAAGPIDRFGKPINSKTAVDPLAGMKFVNTGVSK